MEYAKLVLGTLAMPPAAPLLVVLAGLWLGRRRPVAGRAVAAIGVIALWLLSTIVVGRSLERLAERLPALDPARVAATGAQAIVILGGGGQRDFAPEYGGPAVAERSLERVAYGAWLAQRTSLPVLVTGYRIEAIAMRDTLARNFGVEARWVDDRAFDTFANARNSARILHAENLHRILLVSSADHLGRAAREFTAAGLDVIPAPVHVWAPYSTLPSDYLPTAEGLEDSRAALHELLGERVREFFSWSGLRRQRD